MVIAGFAEEEILAAVMSEENFCKVPTTNNSPSRIFIQWLYGRKIDHG
jgi:hypothetical protein